MRLFKFATCFAVVAAMTLCSGAQAQNVNFVNGDFESVLFDANIIPVTGNTIPFDNGGTTLGFSDTTSPFAGLTHGTAQILGDENSFAGFQQQIANIVAGANYTFEFYGRSSAPTLEGIDAEFRIEYFDAAGGVLGPGGIFTNNVGITSTVTDTYQLFSQTNVAPAGATSLRAVVAVQSFGVGAVSYTHLTLPTKA